MSGRAQTFGAWGLDKEKTKEEFKTWAKKNYCGLSDDEAEDKWKTIVYYILADRKLTRAYNSEMSPGRDDLSKGFGPLPSGCVIADVAGTQIEAINVAPVNGYFIPDRKHLSVGGDLPGPPWLIGSSLVTSALGKVPEDFPIIRDNSIYLNKGDDIPGYGIFCLDLDDLLEIGEVFHGQLVDTYEKEFLDKVYNKEYNTFESIEKITGADFEFAYLIMNGFNINKYETFSI